MVLRGPQRGQEKLKIAFLSHKSTQRELFFWLERVQQDLSTKGGIWTDQKGPFSCEKIAPKGIKSDKKRPKKLKLHQNRLHDYLLEHSGFLQKAQNGLSRCSYCFSNLVPPLPTIYRPPELIYVLEFCHGLELFVGSKL